MREKVHLEDTGVDGRLTLKWILEEEHEETWTD
jgi:hypothetical protein